ncbi:MAG: DUF4260 domain-containing protein [Bacteroidota bacterium]|nr:DUF4260 domain-containing protein [Bacteroidota bacterium]
MKIQLKLEELAQFLIAFHFIFFSYSPWWVYLLLILGPDIGMIGYLINTRIGAFTYNIFHHKGLAIVIAFVGHYFLHNDAITLTGVILFGHASMDRMFGYGLKYSTGFQHTHLGLIGNKTTGTDAQLRSHPSELR